MIKLLLIPAFAIAYLSFLAWKERNEKAVNNSPAKKKGSMPSGGWPVDPKNNRYL